MKHVENSRVANRCGLLSLAPTLDEQFVMTQNIALPQHQR
jgi:hypothetical protein